MRAAVWAEVLRQAACLIVGPVAGPPQPEQHFEERTPVAREAALLVEPVDGVCRLHVEIAILAQREEVPDLLLVVAVRAALGDRDVVFTRPDPRYRLPYVEPAAMVLLFQLLELYVFYSIVKFVNL